MQMSPFQKYIHVSKYARWRDDLARRETWPETVERYVEFMCDTQCRGKIDSETRERIRDAILNLRVMPSMRCLMTAGPALAKDNVAGFNCSGRAVDHVEAFDEAMYLLMCGSGVGFSVERQFVSKLPSIPDVVRKSKTVIKVEDSKIGWANAFRELLSLLYQGRIPEWDTSGVRPAGARLRTFGGRASGPAPLESLFRFCVDVFKNAAGRKLTSLECHDIMCKVAEIVVSGGVRRSAMISLSNPSDDRMRYAKSGQWSDTALWRRMANNSALYTEKPSMDVFFREWLALYESKSGERGIVNREAMKKHAAKHGRRDPSPDFIVNPCGEAVLRPDGGLCNLSEAVVREQDTLQDLLDKVEIAAIIGTMQATLTGFRYLNPVWKKNAEEEALLGVSLTGIMDHPVLSGKRGKTELHAWLDSMRQHVVNTNSKWAGILGINAAVAATVVKPSGTVSSLVDSAPGIHPRFSAHYIRTVRGNVVDPVTRFLRDQGVPCEPDVTAPETTLVFSFPVKAPESAVVVDDIGPIEQLELWKSYHAHWCEHQPSITVYVGDHQWMDVGAWVYKNFDSVVGVSFLPRQNHTYQQAPYQEISASEYEAALAKMPDIDWDRLKEYEADDSAVTTSKTAGCAGGACDIVDIN